MAHELTKRALDQIRDIAWYADNLFRKSAAEGKGISGVSQRDLWAISQILVGAVNEAYEVLDLGSANEGVDSTPPWERTTSLAEGLDAAQQKRDS